MRGLITKPTYEGYIGHKYTKIAVKTLQYIKEIAVFLPQSEEVVHTAMIVHSLHQVSHEFRIEERHREFQKFDEEVAHQGTT